MAAHSRSTGLVITESFLSPAMARRLVDGWIAPALCNSCDSEVGRDAHSANRVPDLHSSEWRRREGTPRLDQAVHDTSLLTVSINWQTDAIKDQVRNCKELIESKGWIVVEEYIKSDSGLSGATFETREGLQALLQAAKQSPRPLDCIVMDDTSRLARRLAKALSVDELVRYYGISLYFVTQQIDTREAPSRIAIIFNGMMDEDCIANLAAKVHRGQKGRALEGLIPGGRCCGYNNIPIEDHSRRGEYGRPAVIGVRAEINQAEAEVVRRILDLYGTGTYSLDQIARELNGIPPPKPRNGNLNPRWTATGLFTILQNERYRGNMVWNKTRTVRNPESEKLKAFPRPESEWVVVPNEDIRIVSDEQWEKVQLQIERRQKLFTIPQLGGVRSMTSPLRMTIYMNKIYEQKFIPPSVSSMQMDTRPRTTTCVSNGNQTIDRIGYGRMCLA